jgi:hypothetical protein
MIFCDNCELWCHVECDGIDNSAYDNLSTDGCQYFCPGCREKAADARDKRSEEIHRFAKRGLFWYKFKSQCKFIRLLKATTGSRDPVDAQTSKSVQLRRTGSNAKATRRQVLLAKEVSRVRNEKKLQLHHNEDTTHVSIDPIQEEEAEEEEEDTVDREEKKFDKPHVAVGSNHVPYGWPLLKQETIYPVATEASCRRKRSCGPRVNVVARNGGNIPTFHRGSLISLNASGSGATSNTAGSPTQEHQMRNHPPYILPPASHTYSSVPVHSYHPIFEQQDAVFRRRLPATRLPALPVSALPTPLQQSYESLLASLVHVGVDVSFAQAAYEGNEPLLLPASRSERDFSLATETEVFGYLKRVQEAFHAKPSVVDYFMNTVALFKKKEIQVLEVMRRVHTMFEGHRGLILGFNRFLPRSCDMSMFDDPMEVVTQCALPVLRLLDKHRRPGIGMRDEIRICKSAFKKMSTLLYQSKLCTAVMVLDLANLSAGV